MASGLNISSIPSVPKAPCTAWSGEVRLGQNPHEIFLCQVLQFDAERKRPCSSGIRSLGLVRWNAPAAMNRM